jgi:hypothetical protein
MQPRADFYTASPDAMKAMMALENAVSKLSLEKSLLELVKLRSSQINGYRVADTTEPDPRAGRRL